MHRNADQPAAQACKLTVDQLRAVSCMVGSIRAANIVHSQDILLAWLRRTVLILINNKCTAHGTNAYEVVRISAV